MSTRVTKTFRIDLELLARLKAIAQRERRSEAWLVAEAVREFVERRETQQG